MDGAVEESPVDETLDPYSELDDESLITAFGRRVGDGMRSHIGMSKSMVQNAVRLKGAGRCPVRLNRLDYATIVKHGYALAELFSEHPDDVVAVFPYSIWIGYQAADSTEMVNPVAIALNDSEWTDEWGTRWRHLSGIPGAISMEHPLKDWSQLDDYLSRMFPNAEEPARMEAGEAQIEKYGDTKYCIGQIHMPLFDRLQALRGFENLLMDLYMNEHEVRTLSEALCDYIEALIRRWGKIGADAILMADDWGTQQQLMISPDMWRKIFKPYYRRMVDEAHRCGMDVIFHSCGNVTEIIGDFIDIGVDVLDPIQPGAMDHERVSREYGGKIAFCGAVDIQDVLVNSTPLGVGDYIRKTIDLLGKRFGNSLIIGPGNMVTPDVPIDNWRAMFEACHSQ